MKMYMTVGNVGCGKSFLSSKLAKQCNGIIVNKDCLREMISGGDYRYIPENESLVKNTILYFIENCMLVDRNIIIDETNLTVEKRKVYLDLAKKYNYTIIVYNFGSGNSEELRRRLEDDRGVPHISWQTVWESMHDIYELPTFYEGIDNIFEPPHRFVFHAFDFDGTICSNEFPNVGKPIEKITNYINKLYENIFNVIIIWTCRDGDKLNEAKEFLHKNKIKFDFINENPLVNFGSSKKVYADFYYDDRNVSLGSINEQRTDNTNT